ncbi:MAG: hypothetical protein LBE20_01940 [Deltaproteobacteria bacterium]|jgi:hypothetical protein|nr:hypothetical protein [Deltaproteobacteria bacterium]
MNYGLKLDSRLIFLLVFIVVAIPLVYDSSIKPAKMETANVTYQELEKLAENQKNGKPALVLIAADLAPSTQSENEPQTSVLIEHLLRRRIPFGLISLIPFATPYLEQMPQEIVTKLAQETGETWEYGKDWVNFGYRPGSTIMIQKFAKSKDLHEFFKTDAQAIPMKKLEIMKGIKTIQDIPALIELTGTVGVFNVWLQFFRSDQHVPTLIHGCTAITIPEAYNYFITNQISGLLEGVAGAAWYEELLSEVYPARKPGHALKIMTALSIGNILIIVLIGIGNLQELWNYWKNKRTRNF